MNWKLVFGVVFGTVLVVALSAWGLAKMSKNQEETDGAQEDLVVGSEWVSGDENSKVTVVEFACLECPACRTAHPISIKLRQMENVRYVWRFFPLVNTHKNAYAAAKATEAARRLDKGWEMADLLFDKQSEWSGVELAEKLEEYVDELNLEFQEFDDLYESPEVKAYVDGDVALASRLRLNGTPTFFVNGKLTASSFVISEVEKLLSEN